MQLDWIEDILAVIDTGSLARAAERRLLTQPAFTRRIRMIEQRLGVTLFDRTRKPVAVMPGVLALEQDLRDTSTRLRRLEQGLRLSARVSEGGIVFACQHAIATTVLPRLVQELGRVADVPVRVRTGNRDDCLMLLLTAEADFVVTYDSPGLPEFAPEATFQAADLG